ncbi:glycoside hydrolase family 43 protein [Pseudoalteromonas prydzensis]|uniref:glycoside hydrolase family 43 protein n=1 Tax=Pseudoalteromonas prydzensis TaxID=182141 RepID=UPI0024BC0155|nr:family 43 glycosylhydrolase [Pseudoalteromonas prydzensis]|eukprot:TRINITY_DN312_c0_g1_i1.p1 TRINITY_DN312_c0_g1~~TRINITY_DN312_c0_g1_i1.p1  ORF type:complete len:343 (+),score=78.39 TRINITY_DN312_c0_g1_i1:115-1143(+)
MLKKRSLFPIVSMLLAMPTFSYADANSSASVTPIDNPIVLQRADPWLVRDDKTGCYTFIGTSPKFDEIELRQACRLNDLKLAEPKVIWQKNAKGPMSANIWAPELHKVDGSWYIHFAAGDVEKPFSIRMYVLKNDSENPMQGNWQEMGQLKTHLDSFSLDATTFSHNGKRYLVWAQQNQPATYNSALWIAEMDSPTSIKEPIVAITEPTLDWEVQGYKVNEGAAVMIREGKVLLTYSASATDHRYAMGLLWADADADLLDPASWHKKQQPIFASNEKVGRFGPGHSSFVKAEDGVTDLLIYHSRDYKELQGTPLTDPNRHARARIIEWDENGFPVLSPDKPD